MGGNQAGTQGGIHVFPAQPLAEFRVLSHSVLQASGKARQGSGQTVASNAGVGALMVNFPEEKKGHPTFSLFDSGGDNAMVVLDPNS